MDIRRFRHFCEQHFHLKENAQELSDGRPRPRIRPSSIFHALFHLEMLGLGSLLGLDQFLRFGRFMASCFAEIGSVYLMGELEAIPKFGKELPSSQRLLRRLLVLAGWTCFFWTGFMWPRAS